MSEIKNIQPKEVWSIFDQMCQIPHPSNHEDKIQQWAVNFGKDLGLETIKDEVGNVIIKKPANGWRDITIAFPINLLEIENIKRLSATIKLNVLVENKEGAELLAENIANKTGVFIKIDTGHHRTGISSTKTGLINSILKILSGNSKLIFKGFLSHTGHTYLAKSTNEIFSRHFDALLKLKALKQKYKKDYPNIEVTTGDTPSASICTTFSGIDEIRPGNFIFYDLMQQNLGVCNMEDIAVRMVCPVIAKHLSRNEIIIYGGAVHMSKDSIVNINGKKMYGRIIIRENGKKKLLDPLNYVAKLSQEHGTLKVTQNQFKNFKVGDLIEIIPVHSCLTANLIGHCQTTDGEPITMMPKF